MNEWMNYYSGLKVEFGFWKEKKSEFEFSTRKKKNKKLELAIFSTRFSFWMNELLLFCFFFSDWKSQQPIEQKQTKSN